MDYVLLANVNHGKAEQHLENTGKSLFFIEVNKEHLKKDYVRIEFRLVIRILMVIDEEVIKAFEV